MYELYTIPGTCSTGIAVLLEKLGVDYKLTKRDDVENYTEIVPTNQVPALKTETGQIIAEGAAITQFLLEKHGADLLPETPEEKATFLQWLNFDYATLHPAYSKLFAVSFKIDLEEDVKQSALEQLAEQLSDLWAILDRQLEGKKYILGDTVSHADYMATIYTSWVHYFPTVDIKLGDNIKRLAADVSNLPEFKAAYIKEQTEFKAAA